MATFLITGTDGKKYKVTGETAAGALQALKKMRGGTATPPAPEQPAVTQTPQQPVPPVVAEQPMPAQTAPVQPAAVTPPPEVPVDMMTGLPVGPAPYDPNEVTAPKKEELPLQWGSLPMGADPETDAVVGRDEGGNPLYESRFGVQYSVQTVLPDPNAPKPKPVSEITLGDVASGTKDFFGRIATGMIEGVKAPGRALSGEPVTNAEGMNPGIYMPGGVPRAAATSMTPSLGMSGKLGGVVAGQMEKIPGIGGVIARDAQRAVSEMGNFAGKVVAALGGGRDAFVAGRGLKAELQTFVNKTKGRMEELYDRVGQFGKEGEKLVSGKVVAASNTADALANLSAVFERNPEIAKILDANKYAALQQELAAKGATWGALRKFRTEIGEAISKGKGTLGDDSTGSLKQIYGALTRDMEAAVADIGPEALTAWKRANDYTRSRAGRIEDQLDTMITADTPERAFELFRSAACGDKATSNLGRLRAVRSSVSDTEWSKLAGDIVDRMGKARAGAQGAEGDVFSPATFLTEWNKVAPGAKSTLFDARTRTQLDILAKFAEAAKTGALEKNASNTGAHVWTSLLSVAGYSQPVKTATAYGAGYGLAKAMTNPVFLTAVNKGLIGDLRALEGISRTSAPYSGVARAILAGINQQALQGTP